MTYYRLIFRKGEDGVPEWSNIMEQDMSEEDFSKMNWPKPIIRFPFKDELHFVSLEETYLDAMILGISTYKTIEGS